MRNVYIIGVGMTRFGKHLDRTEKDLVKEALERANGLANFRQFL